MSKSPTISPRDVKKEIENIEDEKKIEKLVFYMERLDAAADRVDVKLRKMGFLKD